MKLSEIQNLLMTLMNSPPNNVVNVDQKFLKLIDDARETVVDILMEGASKQDILEAIIELIIVATLMKIDVEKEINKYVEKLSIPMIN